MLSVDEKDLVDLDADVINAYDTLEGVLQVLADKNLSEIPTPGEAMPVMPTDIGALPPAALGELYSKILAWYNFVLYELARAQSMSLQSKNRVTYVKSKLKKLQPKEDHELHPALIAAKTEQQIADQRVLMVEAISKVLGKNITVVSRTIEIHRVSLMGEVRNIGLGNIRQYEDTRWALGPTAEVEPPSGTGVGGFQAAAPTDTSPLIPEPIRWKTRKSD